MFFQLLFIHLFRPFLKYTQQTSPLPQNVSPRKLCTQAAGMISKLMRLYKRSHGLRQICNITVYIVHSACTIHLLNLPEKNARRDIVHGVKHLEEIAEGWLCARRTLGILSVLARKWNVELPEEAATVRANRCQVRQLRGRSTVAKRTTTVARTKHDAIIVRHARRLAASHHDPTHNRLLPWRGLTTSHYQYHWRSAISLVGSRSISTRIRPATR